MLTPILGTVGQLASVVWMARIFWTRKGGSWTGS